MIFFELRKFLDVFFRFCFRRGRGRARPLARRPTGGQGEAPRTMRPRRAKQDASRPLKEKRFAIPHELQTGKCLISKIESAKNNTTNRKKVQTKI